MGTTNRNAALPFETEAVELLRTIGKRIAKAALAAENHDAAAALARAAIDIAVLLEEIDRSTKRRRS